MTSSGKHLIYSNCGILCWMNNYKFYRSEVTVLVYRMSHDKHDKRIMLWCVCCVHKADEKGCDISSCTVGLSLGFLNKQFCMKRRMKTYSLSLSSQRSVQGMIVWYHVCQMKVLLEQHVVLVHVCARQVYLHHIQCSSVANAGERYGNTGVCDSMPLLQLVLDVLKGCFPIYHTVQDAP